MQRKKVVKLPDIIAVFAAVLSLVGDLPVLRNSLPKWCAEISLSVWVGIIIAGLACVMGIRQLVGAGELLEWDGVVGERERFLLSHRTMTWLLGAAILVIAGLAFDVSAVAIALALKDTKVADLETRLAAEQARSNAFEEGLEEAGFTIDGLQKRLDRATADQHDLKDQYTDLSTRASELESLLVSCTTDQYACETRLAQELDMPPLARLGAGLDSTTSRGWPIVLEDQSTGRVNRLDNRIVADLSLSSSLRSTQEQLVLTLHAGDVDRHNQQSPAIKLSTDPNEMAIYVVAREDNDQGSPLPLWRPGGDIAHIGFDAPATEQPPGSDQPVSPSPQASPTDELCTRPCRIILTGRIDALKSSNIYRWTSVAIQPISAAGERLDVVPSTSLDQVYCLPREAAAVVLWIGDDLGGSEWWKRFDVQITPLAQQGVTRLAIESLGRRSGSSPPPVATE